MPDLAVEIPPPTAEGTLAKTPLPQVLVYVLERQLTGTLEFTGPARDDGSEPKAKLLVLDGQPSKIWTSEAAAYLGNVLLELGYITDAQLNTSLGAMSRQTPDEKKLHGQLLVAMGAIAQEQLVIALRVQLSRKIESLFAWPAETRFAYYDGFDALASYGGDDFVHIDSLPLVWASIRQEPPWEHVHAMLQRVGNSPLRLSPTAQLDRFELLKDERATAEVLRVGAMRLHDLVGCRLIAAGTTQLLVYCLLITRQVEVLGSAPAADPSRQQIARVQLQQVAQPASNAIVEERPKPSASDPRIASPIPPGDDAQAAVVLSPPPKESARRISVSAMEVAARTKSNRSMLAPTHEARRKEILERFAAIKSQNYFEMLGVAKEASVEEVQAAFFKLAKIWHPDRVPPFLADVKDQCASVFSHMSEAQRTLIDPKQRDQYMKLLREGGATPDDQAQIVAVVEAATNFQKAEICLRRSDFTQAEALCRKAHAGDPKQPDYLALLAWLESMKPDNQSPQGTLMCIAKLDQAILMSERCERAYFYRGMLHKRMQNGTAAVRDFRKSAELNPRNIDAVREVRLFEMRKSRNSKPPRPGDSVPPRDSQRPAPISSKKPPPPAEPGLGKLFGKLFKK